MSNRKPCARLATAVEPALSALLALLCSINLAEARKLAAVEGAVSPFLPASPAPPPAPPCTVDMLKQRPAGDKSWPIKCHGATLSGVDRDLVLSGAHLSYGDFKEATFVGTGAIRLNEAGLAHADLSGSKVSTGAGEAPTTIDAIIDFSGANLTNANLSDSRLTSESRTKGNAAIVFTDANLANADLRGSTLTADSALAITGGEATIDFSGANLAHADLSRSTLTADSSYGGDATIDFSETNLAHADLSDSKLAAEGFYSHVDSESQATIDFHNANLVSADLSGTMLTAKHSYGDTTINFREANLAEADLSGSVFVAETSYGDTTIDFSKANFANANLSNSILAVNRWLSSYGEGMIDFSEANLENADLSGSRLFADGAGGSATISFTKANLANADMSGSELTADSTNGSATIDFTEVELNNADLSGSKFTAEAIIGLPMRPSSPPPHLLPVSPPSLPPPSQPSSSPPPPSQPPSPPPPSSPPPPPPPPRALSPPPPPPLSTGAVILKLTASGSVSDYSDTSSLQQKIAAVAAVDLSAVEINLAAASVRITASIAVPASTTAKAMQLLLSTSLGTAATASAQLGIIVEEPPSIEIEDGSAGLPKSPGAQGDATMFALYVGSSIVATAIFAACYVAWRRRLKKTRSAWSGKVDPTLTFSGSSASDPMMHAVQIDLPHVAPDSAYTAASSAPDKGVLLDGTAQLRTGMEWYR